jgi:hypothetical protein
MSWIRTVPGIVDTDMSTVLDWRWLASSDDVVELCELFFPRNGAGDEASEYAPAVEDEAPA